MNIAFSTASDIAINIKSINADSSIESNPLPNFCDDSIGNTTNRKNPLPRSSRDEAIEEISVLQNVLVKLIRQ